MILRCNESGYECGLMWKHTVSIDSQKYDERTILYKNKKLPDEKLPGLKGKYMAS